MAPKISLAVSRIATLAFFVVSFVAPRPLPAGTVTWTSDASGSWHTAANWSSNPSLPGTADDVRIERPAASVTVTHYTSSGTNSINSLTCSEELTVSGGTLSLAAASTLSGPLLISNGTLTFNGTTASSVTGTATLSGGRLDGNGVVDFTNLAWTNGTMEGSGVTVIPSSRTLSFSGNASKALYRTLDNYGTVVWTGTGPIYGDTSGKSGALHNRSGATFDAQSDAFMDYGSATRAIFNNTGLFKRSTSSGTSSIEWQFNNTGTVEVRTGMLSLDGGGMSTGTFSVMTGATLRFYAGTHELGGATFANAGTLNFSGGTASFGTATTVPGVANLTGGTLTGAGNVTFHNLTWTGGTMSGSGTAVIPAGMTLNIAANSWLNLYRTLDNYGTVVWTGASTIQGGTAAAAGVLNNRSGATLDAQADGTLYWTSTTGTLNNAGLFKKSAGTGTTKIDWNFNNTGTVEVQSGTLSIEEGITSTGAFSVSTAATLRFQPNGSVYELGGSAFTNNGTINFSGTVNFGTAATIPGAVTITGGTLAFAAASTLSGPLTFSGGTVLFNGTATSSVTGPATMATYSTLDGTGVVSFSNLTWTGGTMAGSGTTVIPGGQTLNISGGSGKFLYRTLDNYGTATWTDTGFIRTETIGAGGVVNNRGQATFDAQSDSTLYYYGSTPGAFNNAGLFKKSAGTGTTRVDVFFNNTGTAEVRSGTLSLYGGGTSSGTFNVLPGTTLDFAGGVHEFTGATFTNAGTINFSGGTAGFDTATVLPGTVNFNGAAVNFNGAAASSITGAATFSNGSLAGNGPVSFSNLTWTRGQMTGSGTTVIPGGKMLNIGGSSYKDLYRTLDNNGTVVWTGTGNIHGGIAGVLNNLGGATLDAQGDAALYYYGSTPPTFNNAGLFKKSAGTGTTGIDWYFNNTGTVEVQSGTLSITRVFNNAGTARVQASTMLASAGVNGAGTTTVGEGTVAASLAAKYIRQNVLSIAAGATATIAPNPTPADKATTVSVLASNAAAPNNALRIANGGALDLNNNDLITYYPTGSGAATLANIQQYIYDGFLNTAGVPQIQADKTLGTYQTYAVAFDNAALSNPWTSWAGQSLTGRNQVITKYTYRGDMDLNGVVDGNDFTVIQQNFGLTGLGVGKGWMKGDADLNGTVDGNDFTIIQQNFGAGSGSPLSPPEGNTVPEPPTLAMALLAALGGLWFWRCKQRSV